MSISNLVVYRAFVDFLPLVSENAHDLSKTYFQEFTSRISALTPPKARQLALDCLQEQKPDLSLVGLYRKLNNFINNSFGDQIFDDTGIVEDVAATVLAFSGGQTLDLSVLPLLQEAMTRSIAQQYIIESLENYVAGSGTAVQEYRIAQLEGKLKTHEDNDERQRSEFTVTQQVLALHFLLSEAMSIQNVDNTKVIALCHLLAGKKIPIRQGKENIANSGIKTAFSKMRQKHPKNQLSDLHFVLKFFKPFENNITGQMDRVVQAIEKEIMKLEKRQQKGDC